jgi:Uma2 family endonuclease
MIHPGQFNKEWGYQGLRMTAAEFLSLGETAERYELIDGVVVMSPSPVSRHQIVIASLIAECYGCRPQAGRIVVIPDMSTEVGARTVYEPDLSVFLPGRVTRSVASVGEPADLIIEVLSPASGNHDLTRKRDDYQVFGVGEYWVIDPGPVAAKVWRRGRSGFVGPEEHAGLVECRSIPGLKIDLAQVRADADADGR